MANPVHFLRMYFNCAYYLGLFPFRFRFSPETGSYVIVRNIWQTIIWLIICFLTISNCIYFAIWEYDLQIKRISGPGRPEIYFRRVNLLTDVMNFLIILITQCTGAEKLLKVFNTLHESTSYDSTHKNQFRVCWVPCLFVFFGSITIPMILSCFSNSSWDFADGVYLLRSHGIAQMFLHNLIPESTFFTFFFASLRIVTIIFYTLYMTSGELLLLSCSFAVNDCLNRFSEFVRDENTDGLEAVSQFKSLKMAMGLLNDALGLLIFGIVFGLLPYFVVTFASFVNPESPWDFAINLHEFSILYWFLGFAANIGRKANVIMERFIHTKDLSELSLFQLNSILYDINSHFVEFNCAGFCNISPGFVGGMIQLLLTFSVILIQFQMPSGGDKSVTRF